MTQRHFAAFLALAALGFFMRSSLLIMSDAGAILPALGLFLASLLLGSVSFVTFVLAPVRQDPIQMPTQQAPEHEYRPHNTPHDLDCDSCGQTIDAGDRYFCLWAYDPVLGFASDTDAPRLCEHCTTIRQHADVLGIDGTTSLFASGEIDEQVRDEMIDYLLSQEQ